MKCIKCWGIFSLNEVAKLGKEVYYCYPCHEKALNSPTKCHRCMKEKPNNQLFKKRGVWVCNKCYYLEPTKSW